MKRILHVLAQRPGKTGSGIFLQSLYREAFNLGYEQAVIVGIPKDEVVQLPGLNHRHFFPVRFETNELPFPVVGMSDVMPYKSTRYRDLTDEMLNQWKAAFQTKLAKAVEIFQPDVILSHHLWILTSFTKRLFPQIPLIAICHGTGLRQLTLAPQFTSDVKSGCNHIEKILALNAFQKKKIVENYAIDPDKIIITGSAYNSNIFYPADSKINTDKIKLVYCGKYSFAKGVVQLIRVFDRLNCEKSIELTLVGSGTGKEADKIINLAQKSSNPIRLQTPVPQDELVQIFRRHHLFILPSFYEGLPLVVIEALSCGLRVITTDIPGLKDWIGDSINKKGIIEYVPLPRMINSDIPVKEYLPAFEQSFQLAIERQIKLFKNYGNPVDTTNFTKDKSWEALFRKIENIMESVVK